MDLGVAFFPTDLGVDIAAVARLAEERPFYALFVAEHTHIPVSRETPHPSGDVLPDQYSHTLDPFVALSFAAAATERIKVGTGVCLVVERDPIVTAKEVASLDRLSGGRFLFGVGAGWNREEMSNHGTRPSTTASTSTSTRSGAGRSRCSSRTRRCCSAAPGPRCSIGCSPTPTSGRRIASAAPRS